MILVLDQHLEVTYVFELSKVLNFVELALASVNIISPFGSCGGSVDTARGPVSGLAPSLLRKTVPTMKMLTDMNSGSVREEVPSLR